MKRMKLILLLVVYVFYISFNNGVNAGDAKYIEVFEKTIDDIRPLLLSGDLSCAQLVDLYFRRISAYDRQGPSLRAIINVNPNAYKEAQEYDKRYKSGEDMSKLPMYCMPIIVKDNYDVVGIPSTQGVFALSHMYPKQDAHVVSLLKKAGCIVIAKANMAEMSWLGQNTYSSINGQSLNPYNPFHTPYGSSGGSGISTAASFAMFSLGTDSSGSILLPSSASSNYGMRSTIGLIDTEGIAPAALSDVSGPIARSVSDLAKAMEIMVDKQYARYGPQDYTNYLKADGLKGIKIAFIKDFLNNMTSPIVTKSDYEVMKLSQQMIADLQAAGATVMSVDAMPLLQNIIAPVMSIKGECPFYKHDIEEYFASFGPDAPYHNFHEIVQSLQVGTSEDIVSIYIGKDSAPNVTNPYETEGCFNYFKTIKKAADDIATFMKSSNIDVFMMPATNQRLPTLFDISPSGWFNSDIVSSLTGIPALNVPIGFAPSNLPVGMTLFAPAYSEALLIQCAYAYSVRSSKRAPPMLTPPLSLKIADYYIPTTPSDESEPCPAATTTSSSSSSFHFVSFTIGLAVAVVLSTIGFYVYHKKMESSNNNLSLTERMIQL